jgi:acyl carrier protein
MGVFEVDWNVWVKGLFGRFPSRFSSLISRTDDANEEVAQGKALREALLSATDAARRELMGSFLRRQAAQVMRSSPASLDVSKPLHELGLDSLMAVELTNRIEGELGLALPSGTLMGSQNLSAMAATLVEIIKSSSPEIDHRSDGAKPTALNGTNEVLPANSLGRELEDHRARTPPRSR